MKGYFNFEVFSIWVFIVGVVCLLLVAGLPGSSPLPPFALYVVVGLGGGSCVASAKPNRYDE